MIIKPYYHGAVGSVKKEKKREETLVQDKEG